MSRIISWTSPYSTYVCRFKMVKLLIWQLWNLWRVWNGLAISKWPNTSFGHFKTILLACLMFAYQPKYLLKVIINSYNPLSEHRHCITITLSTLTCKTGFNSLRYLIILTFCSSNTAEKINLKKISFVVTRLRI